MLQMPRNGEAIPGSTYR